GFGPSRGASGFGARRAGLRPDGSGLRLGGFGPRARRRGPRGSTPVSVASGQGTGECGRRTANKRGAKGSEVFLANWWRWTLQRLLKAPLFLTAFHVLGRIRDRIT